MHFNSLTTKHFGTFVGKEEQRHSVTDLTAIYQLAGQIEGRLRELDESIAKK